MRDSLTILLNLVDKSKKGFQSFNKRLTKTESNMTRFQKRTELARKAVTGLFAAGTTLAIRSGVTLFNELNDAALRNNVTFREFQQIFRSVQDVDPSVTVDRLSESILSLSERFADAAAGAGPLKGLIDTLPEFGKLNLNLDDPTEQLSEFLGIVRQLERSQKIFAIKEIFGDEDGAAFLKLFSKELGVIDGFFEDINAKTSEFTGLLSAGAVDDIKIIKDDVSALGVAWDRFSLSVLNLLSFFQPAFSFILSVPEFALNAFAKLFNNQADSMRGFLAVLEEGLGQFVSGDGIDLLGFNRRIVEMTAIIKSGREELEKDENGSGSSSSFGTGLRFINEYGRFDNKEQFEKWFAQIQKDTLATTNENNRITIADPDPVKGINLLNNESQTEAIMEANAQRDIERELADSRIAIREAEIDSIQQYADAFSGAGDAFGAFAALAQGKSDSVFKTFQRLQIALSTAAGISAQIAVLASPDTPTFAQKLGAYFKIGAIVASGLASLRSINVGGGTTSTPTTSLGTNAGSGTSNSAATLDEVIGSRTKNDRIVNVSVQGNTFSADGLVDFVEALNDNDLGIKINANKVAGN